MTSFTELDAYQRLAQLAENPLDLTKKGVMTPKRIDAMIAEGLGLKLFYACERVDAAVLEALFALADERKVVDKML